MAISQYAAPAMAMDVENSYGNASVALPQMHQTYHMQPQQPHYPLVPQPMVQLQQHQVQQQQLQQQHQQTAAEVQNATPLVDGDDQGDLSSLENGEPPYQCKICGKGFAIPARLQRHHRVHTGEKPFKCEFCEKTFSVKENLNVHRRIHTKERPYKCTICGRAFEHSGKLHRHMRTHTGERPHKCEVCGKTFVQSGQLVIHMRAHTGEKPYTCEYCQKGFTCSKQLKVHIRTHTGEKPYECDVCGKTFGYNHVLKMHKMSHLGEKLYKCTLCEEFFNSRKALDRHIRDHSQAGRSRKQHQQEAVTKQQQDTCLPPDWKSMFSTAKPEGEITPPIKASPSSSWENDSIDQPPTFRELREASNSSCDDNNSIHAFEVYSSNNSGSGTDILCSRSPGYVSDDSGRGPSPISDTFSPPRSPNAPGSPLTPPHIMDDHPVMSGSHQTDSYNMLLRRMYPGITMPKPEATPYEHYQPAQHMYTQDTTSSYDKTKYAVFTTESGEKVTCPYDLLLCLQRKKDHSYLQEKTVPVGPETLRRQQQQIEEHFLREETRRRREQTFIESVRRVLEALIGTERLQRMGHPHSSVDEVLMQTLSFMGSQPCKEPSLTPMDRVKVNLRLLLECSVPDQEMWNKFGWRGKPVEEIVSEFLNFC